MVIRFDQLQKAVCSFMETDILVKAAPSRRLLIGAAIMVAPKWMERKYAELLPYITMLELGTEDGTIDIDKAEESICELIGRYGPYTKDLAGMHIVLDQQDVHKLASVARSM